LPLTRRVKSRRVDNEIDWSLLLMFAGLFVIVASARRAADRRHASVRDAVAVAVKSSPLASRWPHEAAVHPF
jgi:Na+/H+ antiporter NhaD/arsenite permease-like protein